MFWNREKRKNLREELLRAVHEDNVRLHKPGFTHRMSRRQPRRERALIIVAAILLSIAGLLQIRANLPEGQSSPAQPAVNARAVHPAHPQSASVPLGVAAPAEIAIAQGNGKIKASGNELRMSEVMGLSARTIMIDAGHGGHDPGAIGKAGLREKDIALDVSLRLQRLLSADKDYRIIMTRSDDRFIPLRERARIANDSKVDLFISIHVNYMTGTSLNAIETYYFGNYRDPASKEVARIENKDSGYTISEFEAMGREMQDEIKLEESKTLARMIQGSLLKNIRAGNERVLDTGVRPAPFVVLYAVKSPSVLAEIGSLSSPEAEARFRSEEYREQIASHLAAGIRSYLKQHLKQQHLISTPTTTTVSGGQHHGTQPQQ